MNGIINRLGTVLKDTDVDLSLDNIITVTSTGNTGLFNKPSWDYLPNKYSLLGITYGTGNLDNPQKGDYLIREWKITNHSSNEFSSVFYNNPTQGGGAGVEIYLTMSKSSMQIACYKLRVSGATSYREAFLVYLYS